MKRTRFAKRGLQNDHPHQHLLRQGVLREVPHRPQPHGRGVAQPDVFLRELQVKSTTPERLALVRRAHHLLPPIKDECYGTYESKDWTLEAVFVLVVFVLVVVRTVLGWLLG